MSPGQERRIDGPTASEPAIAEPNAAEPADAPVPSVVPTEAPRVREIQLDGLYALEVVFGGADFDAPLPTVWSFHGRGDRPRVPGGPFDGMPAPYRVVVPRGPLPLGEEWSWLPYRVAEGRTAELTEALLARVDELGRAMRLHAERVPYVGRAIVTGFSQGGVIAFALAVRRPDLVGFALPNAGWLPPALVPTSADWRAAPIRSMHGTADPIVTYEPTRAVVEQLRAVGLDVLLLPFEGVAHDMSEPMNAQFHRWLEEALRRARAEGGAAEGR
jgi:phospholipase/carboxylesterase